MLDGVLHPPMQQNQITCASVTTTAITIAATATSASITLSFITLVIPNQGVVLQGYILDYNSTHGLTIAIHNKLSQTTNHFRCQHKPTIAYLITATTHQEGIAIHPLEDLPAGSVTDHSHDTDCDQLLYACEGGDSLCLYILPSISVCPKLWLRPVFIALDDGLSIKRLLNKFFI